MSIHSTPHFDKATLPRVSTPIASLHVIVHPHFDVVRSDASFLTGQRDINFQSFQASKQLTTLVSENEVTASVGYHLELMHRFYKHEISRIKRNAGAVLAIVPGEVEYFPDDDYSDSPIEGIPRTFIAAVGSYQRRLIDFASDMGNRFLLVRADERHIGIPLARATKEIWQSEPEQVPTYVFGEWRDACVYSAYESMRSAGFVSTSVLKNKCAPLGSTM